LKDAFSAISLSTGRTVKDELKEKTVHSDRK
jgi:hypothetical protein